MRFLWFLPLCTALRNGLPFKVPLFEPNVVAKGIQPLFLREAELKHGRLAMVASLVIPLSETSQTLGIHQFETLPYEIQWGIITLMFMSEFRTMGLGWDPKKPFTILDNYLPGDFGLKLSIPNIWYVDSELNHSRLAMLGVFGMMVQELVTQQPLFPH